MNLFGLGQPEPAGKKSTWLDRLRHGLSRTQNTLVKQVEELAETHGQIDEDLLESLEDILIQGDVGVDSSMALAERVRRRRSFLRELPFEFLQVSTVL